MTKSDLQELQHFAKLGRFSANLLHEITNPLSAVILNLEQCDMRASPALRRARRDAQLMWRYVEAARQQIRLEGRSINFSIASQVDQLKRIIMPLAKGADVTVVFEPVPHCRLHGDPVKFQQLLANLIINAIDAYRDDLVGERHKTVRVALTLEAKYLNIRVVDWGKGITADQLGYLFKPFYTTKPNGHSLGIGLAIVREYVVTDFKGSVKVHSSLRQGTQFIVRLPRLS